MADLRASRCEQLTAPVTALTIAVVGCNERLPHTFTDVITAAEDVRDIAELGSAGVGDNDYVAWAAGAPATLTAMIEAAQAKSTAGIWEAFSHPQFGLHRLATACAGLPGWAVPEGSEFA
ncbi:hypothetical protein AUC47_00025 [Microbacterium sp. SZ1]|uniref:hypothetical protein n=1 Tax=Microbacterium sp. SZ1 TaxID=1849736 RepID=UPI000BBBEAF0|nr:hypothetical protein [Microbacterium sp. SZ1]PCE16281.1 hypothetical protein AUC47_00025 [Microbacterium sp. SZ1]